MDYSLMSGSECMWAWTTVTGVCRRVVSEQGLQSHARGCCERARTTVACLYVCVCGVLTRTTVTCLYGCVWCVVLTRTTVTCLYGCVWCVDKDYSHMSVCVGSRQGLQSHACVCVRGVLTRTTVACPWVCVCVVGRQGLQSHACVYGRGVLTRTTVACQGVCVVCEDKDYRRMSVCGV